MLTNPTTHKYLFAHYLRAVGVSMVLLTHIGTAFFNMNAFMASLVNVPPLADTSYPAIVHLLLVPPSLPGFFAVCGVALFFLVSGFVIPFSIEKYRLPVFFTKRFLRLYPTYLLVFFLNAGIALLGYYCFQHAGVAYPYSLRTVIAAAGMGVSNN